MNTLDDFKISVRNMLFASVKNDLESWIEEDGKKYVSPFYDDYQISIDKHYLYLRKDKGEGSYDFRFKYKIVVKYRTKLSIVKDKEVNDIANQLKSHFEKKRQDKLLKNDIDFFEEGLSKIQKNFLPEVRKEKLEQISKKGVFKKK